MTTYYDNPQNVAEYIKMAEGYDGAHLISILKGHLPRGAAVLELGMGPGVDLRILSRDFQVTGSDRAQPFLDLYRQNHPEADLLLLDAITLETDRKFDGIYSNKVLHHLTPDELKRSFERQAALLNAGGIALHSFWQGEGVEEMAGMRFFYHTLPTLAPHFEPDFALLKSGGYAEMETDDSLYVVLQKL
ncbi:MAG: class I SAM-dependent methyltransferase [Caldilineaceae bacterium]